MGLGIPPLRIKIMLESNPLKSIILVRGLGADTRAPLAKLPPGLGPRAAQGKSHMICLVKLMCVYIKIYRERDVYTHILRTYIYLYIYIYVYMGYDV